ncbi:hypothetical protein [Thalassobacillus sp. C254]|uniref:hypothetical protein n=1 Tax=Thalassobacillus sp. C254 TaxID=1225341 RepID=UPI0006D03063|nr:hypothetical protein [Thalassobacillus sp. C254]
MALAEELLKYKEKKDDHGVLSVYLNTDFGEGTQHNGEWKIRLKNGMKRLQEYVEKSGSDEELKAFKNISKKGSRAHPVTADRYAKRHCCFRFC